MNYTLYQMNPDKDKAGMMYLNSNRVIKMNDGIVDLNSYDRVYSSNTESESLEDLFEMLQQPGEIKDYNGRSMSVSDVVYITDNPCLSDGYYFCDSFGWTTLKPIEDNKLIITREK